MPATSPTHILLATLGGQPQVVTFTLDLLLQQHLPIKEVHVVHPAAHPGSHLANSIARLHAEFVDDYYAAAKRVIHFRTHVLQYYEDTLSDINDARGADGALNTMDYLLRSFKKQNRVIHFSISGGRRLISFLSISAALLTFQHEDRMWHIYTPEAVQQQASRGALMHVPPEAGVRLIEVPLARLSLNFLTDSSHLRPRDTREVIQSQRQQALAEDRERCERVIQQLTSRQKEVLQAFAEGLHPQEVAHRLAIAQRTVSSYTTPILGYCRNEWNLTKNVRLDYRFLQQKFRTYFEELQSS